MIVALILLGLGGFVFPLLWLVFLVVLLAWLIRPKPTVIVVNQDGAVTMGGAQPSTAPPGSNHALAYVIFGVILLVALAGYWG